MEQDLKGGRKEEEDRTAKEECVQWRRRWTAWTEPGYLALMSDVDRGRNATISEDTVSGNAIHEQPLTDSDICNDVNFLTEGGNHKLITGWNYQK